MDPAALLETHPIMHIAHRSEEHHFMATVHRWAEAGHVTAMKGAPLDVLDRCSHLTRNGETLPLDDDERHAMEIDNLKMAGKGLRVLGVAYRPEPSPEPPSDEPWISLDEPDFVWVGLVGLADPLRKEARPLIEALHGAGIKTAVITGDQSFTARHIGEELRLSGDAPLRILDASDLRSLDSAAMKSITTQAHIFARLNPTQKLQVVQAYQSAGMSVIMVGDGLNDALALKVADVGIAMGRAGTGLAQRSADLVLEDDNLESVMFAIATGRAFFRNMRKSVRFLLTANHVDVLMALSERSGLMGQGHSMWQSLWTNLMCLSLTLDQPGASFAHEGPVDPEEGLMRPRDLEDTFLDAADIMAGAGATGCYGVARYGTGSEASGLFAQSASINQILYGVKCRETNGEPLGERPSNPFLPMVLLGAVGSRLLAALLPGIGKPLGEMASRTLDALILGASGLLSLKLPRTDEKARPRSERADVDHPVELLRTVSRREA
jgi:Ca2+-transporting ATPase